MAKEPETQFLEYILKGIVRNPSEVKIKYTLDNSGIFLQFRVAHEDLSRVVGKAGATMNSLKMIMKCHGFCSTGSRISIKMIQDDDEFAKCKGK